MRTVAFLSLFSCAALAGVAMAHEHHGPPPEAIDACKAKTAGTACTVTFGDKTIDGTCNASHEDASVLVCHPAHPPGPPPQAIDACKGKAANDTCSVSWGDKTMSGTCSTQGHDGSTVALHCRPQHPHQ